LLAASVLLLAPGLAAGGGDGALASWTTLRFKARGALLRGSFEMRLLEGGLRLETESSARVLGKTVARSSTTTVFDAKTGATRGFESYSRKRARRYVFGACGYTVEKLRAADEPDSSDARWETSSRAEFPCANADDEASNGAIFDYYGMLLDLRRAALERPGDEARYWVATSRGPREWIVTVAEGREVRRKFVDLASGKARHETLHELRLRVTPADPAEEEGFMNMAGETEIWVERRSRAPVEIIGQVPRVGRVRIELEGVR
jgi:hypothetical protein